VCGVLCAFFLACSPPHAWGKSAPRLSPLPKEAVVLAFGDSMTYGIGAVAEESYPANLQKLTGRRVVNGGVPGELTSAGVRRLPSMLSRYRPRLVIIGHGANDIVHGVSERQIAVNLREMVRLSREQGADVIIIGIPRVGASFIRVPAFYRQVAVENGLPSTGDSLAKILEDRTMRVDPFHLNGEGYRRLAEVLAHLLQMSGAL
jgi:lysophospholipase L1-like esterase